MAVIIRGQKSEELGDREGLAGDRVNALTTSSHSFVSEESDGLAHTLKELQISSLRVILEGTLY